MSSSQDTPPKESSQPVVPMESLEQASEKKDEKEELPQIPEAWEGINFQDLFDNGWKPYLRTDNRSGITYIALRRGSKQEKRLGRYDEERWQLLQSMFPKQPLPPPKTNTPSFLDFTPNEVSEAQVEGTEVSKEEGPVSGRQYFKTPIQRVAIIPKAFIPRLLTLYWFEYLKKRGYPNDMNEFLNDIVETHFSKCHGLFVEIVEKVQANG